ncbi:MAG: DUF4230 domain-containing protein [Chloroflexi bacterium]|nr:DUF4230 domain-containing protein [Chloroflexota bacterium]
MEIIKLIFQNIKYFILLLIVFLIISFLTPVTKSVTNFLDRIAPPVTAEIIPSQAIISSLRGIGRLVTITSEPHFREIHIGVRSGLWGLTSYGADHEVEGIIEAGIDFTKIRSDGLKCEESCILILPHPTITNCVITRLRQTEQSRQIGGRDWELLEEIGRYEAIRLFIDDVKELDVIDEAKKQSETVIGNFVRGITELPVLIQFETESDQLITGPTCKPDRPLGWVRGDDGRWSRSGE